MGFLKTRGVLRFALVDVKCTRVTRTGCEFLGRTQLEAVLTTQGSLVLTQVFARRQHVTHLHRVFTLKFNGVYKFLEQYNILSMYFSVFS